MALIGKLNADGMVTIHCPECNAGLKIKPKSARTTSTCVKCNHQFALEVPELEASATGATNDTPWWDGQQADMDLLAEIAPDPKPAKNQPDDERPSKRPARADREERDERPSKRPARVDRDDRDDRDDRPSSGRYQSAPGNNSNKIIAFVVAGGALLLLGGVGLLAALGVFSDDKPDSKQVAVKDDKADKNAKTTPKGKVDPRTKPDPKPQPDPEPEPEPEPMPKPKTPRPMPVEPEPKMPDPTPDPMPDPKPVEPKPVDPLPKMPLPKMPLPPKKPFDPFMEADKQLKEIIARTKAATPLVEGKGGAGSGFVIRPGILVTNAHVIEREFLEDIKVRFVTLQDTDPKPITPTLLYEDRIRDLAVFRFDGSASPLDLNDANIVLEGLAIAVVGNPTQGGGALKIGEVTYGEIRAPARLDDGQIFYQLLARAAPGNSGGPVIDQKTGKVVGVLTAGFRGRPTTFCIPYTDVNKALSRLPATEKEAEGAKIAAARHYLDLLANRLTDIEENAAMAMSIQRSLLRGEEPMFIKGEKRLTAQEVLRELKDEHAKVFTQLQKTAQAHIQQQKDVPGPMKLALTSRLEACGYMRQLADSKPTMGEAAYAKQMDTRKANSETAVKRYDAELKKYRDQIEQKYLAPPK